MHGVVVEPSRSEALVAVIPVTPRTIDDFMCESVDALTATRRRLRGRCRCWGGCFAGGHLVVPVAGSGHVSAVLGSGYGGGAFGCGKVAVSEYVFTPGGPTELVVDAQCCEKVCPVF